MTKAELTQKVKDMTTNDLLVEILERLQTIEEKLNPKPVRIKDKSGKVIAVVSQTKTRYEELVDSLEPGERVEVSEEVFKNKQ